MQSSSDSSSSFLVDAQTWARRTMFGGLAGAAIGAVRGYTNGQPAAFLASAYGLNALLFTGSVLGSRSLILKLLERSGGKDGDAFGSLVEQRKALIASSVSGLLVGGAATGFVSGRGRAIPGALLWAGVCGGLQYGRDQFVLWRDARAAEISERRWLWRSLTREQRQEFFSSGAARTASAGSAVTTVDGRPAHEATGVDDSSDPPAADYLPSLRSFAATKGLRYSFSHSALPAPARSSPSTAATTSAAAASVAASSTSSTSSSIGNKAERPWYGWLPIKVGDADAIKLDRLNRRLREVEEALGERKATGEAY